VRGVEARETGRRRQGSLSHGPSTMAGSSEATPLRSSSGGSCSCRYQRGVGVVRRRRRRGAVSWGDCQDMTSAAKRGGRSGVPEFVRVCGISPPPASHRIRIRTDSKTDFNMQSAIAQVSSSLSATSSEVGIDLRDRAAQTSRYRRTLRCGVEFVASFALLCSPRSTRLRKKAYKPADEAGVALGNVGDLGPAPHGLDSRPSEICDLIKR